MRRAARPRRCRARLRRSEGGLRRPTSIGAPSATITLPRQAAVRDPGPVQMGGLFQRSRNRSSATSTASSAAGLGLSVTRSHPRRGRARLSNVGNADAGAAGHERRERLVLDLLEPADGDAVGGPGRRRAPAPRQALSVLRVPAEDTHSDRSAVAGRRTPRRRGAGVDGAQIARLYAERAAPPDPLRRRQPCGGAQREPHDRRRAEAKRQAGERRGGSAAPRATAPSAADRTSQSRRGGPAARAPGPRRRGPRLRRPGGAPGIPTATAGGRSPKPVGVDGAAEQAPQGGDDDEREHDVPQERPAPPEEHVHGDREGESECAHEDEPPERAAQPRT